MALREWTVTLVVRTGENVSGSKVVSSVERLVRDDFYVVDVKAKPPGEVVNG